VVGYVGIIITQATSWGDFGAKISCTCGKGGEALSGGVGWEGFRWWWDGGGLGGGGMEGVSWLLVYNTEGQIRWVWELCGGVEWGGEGGILPLELRHRDASLL
jgi:hypothetical protein